MYTEFLKTEAHKNLPVGGHRRPIAIGNHYRNTIAYVADGGIDAAREVAATMGGISKHHWSKFPDRLLKACQKAHAENIKPYTITAHKNYAGKEQRVLRYLHVSWKFVGDTQFPVIEHW